MAMRMVEVPLDVFDALAAASDPDAVVRNFMPDDKVRDSFARSLAAAVFHGDVKSMGLSSEGFEALFGAPLYEPTWDSRVSADTSGATLQAMTKARLLAAYGGRLLRSDKLLQERIKGATSLEAALAAVMPGTSRPTLDGLKAACEAEPQAVDPTRPLVIYGTLEPFFETGTEGVVWSLQDDLALSYAGLWPIETGDHLEVFGDDGELRWAGPIKLEYKRGRHKQGSWEQQAIEGFWVHGFNADQTPEAWSKMFFDRLRGRLSRAPNDKRPRPRCGHISQVWD